jgi:hypothetical protein
MENSIRLLLTYVDYHEWLLNNILQALTSKGKNDIEIDSHLKAQSNLLDTFLDICGKKNRVIRQSFDSTFELAKDVLLRQIECKNFLNGLTEQELSRLINCDTGNELFKTNYLVNLVTDLIRSSEGNYILILDRLKRLFPLANQWTFQHYRHQLQLFK